MDIKMHPIRKTPNTPDLGDGKNVNPVSVKFLPKKSSKDSCCSIDEEKRQLRAQRPVWRENFSEFCRNGTLHGVRHLVDSYSRTRKIIWLVIIVLIFIIFLWAIISQISLYIKYPVRNVVIDNHMEKIKFPSVTICNKNPCKMSAAYKKGWQNFLTTNATVPSKLESVELLDYQKTCSQKLETMMVMCTFNGVKCNLEHFKSTFTSMGHCYRFQSSGEEDYVTVKPGGKFGLKLLLNAETAEYSPSASGQEGFQISLGDANDVGQNGLSIAPGTSSSLSLRLLRTRSLPPPYSGCGQTKLRTTDVYSRSTCYAECLQAEIRRKCFCNAIFNIPAPDNSFPICGMKIYQTCVQPLKDNITVQSCNCPEECHTEEYRATLSFSKLSNKFIESIVKENSISDSEVDIEQNFVENKLMQYHHANQLTEAQKYSDVIQAYNHSVVETYPFLLSSVANVSDVLKLFSNKSNGRDQFLQYTKELLKQYNEKYHATVFSALESAKLLVNKYLDAVTSFAFVTDQMNYTTGAMDENRVSHILRLKLDEFRIHYEHTIQSLNRVDQFYTDNKLSDYGEGQRHARTNFRTGIMSLYANISAISMHQNGNIDKFYRVADVFNRVILPKGSQTYLWYYNELQNITNKVTELSSQLQQSLKVVALGPRRWDNFMDKTLYRTGEPSYVYEAANHWIKIKSNYLSDPGNVTRRETIVDRVNGDLTNLTHFIMDLSQDLNHLEAATSTCLDIIEKLYTLIIESDIVPASVLGKYPIWDISSQYLDLRIRWHSLAERNRPVFKSVFADIMRRVREKLLSRKIQRHYYPNGVFDRLHTSVRAMEVEITTSLTKLKDHMTYFLNSVSIENVFREELYTDNFCQVDIYFDTLKVRTLRQEPTVSVRDVFLFIGMIFAVYFGGSLFTLIEVIDVVIRSTYTKYCHRDSPT